MALPDNILSLIAKTIDDEDTFVNFQLCSLRTYNLVNRLMIFTQSSYRSIVDTTNALASHNPYTFLSKNLLLCGMNEELRCKLFVSALCAGRYRASKILLSAYPFITGMLELTESDILKITMKCHNISYVQKNNELDIFHLDYIAYRPDLCQTYLDENFNINTYKPEPRQTYLDEYCTIESTDNYWCTIECRILRYLAISNDKERIESLMKDEDMKYKMFSSSTISFSYPSIYCSVLSIYSSKTESDLCTLSKESNITCMALFAHLHGNHDLSKWLFDRIVNFSAYNHYLIPILLFCGYSEQLYNALMTVLNDFWTNCSLNPFNHQGSVIERTLKSFYNVITDKVFSDINNWNIKKEQYHPNINNGFATNGEDVEILKRIPDDFRKDRPLTEQDVFPLKQIINDYIERATKYNH